jgi:trigger factor
METIVQKYQKVARLPGFRSGHVPASIIKQRFKEDLKSDVVEALVPRYFRKEAEKQGMIPVSQPRVTDLHIHDGEPLRFKASFEIMPEIVVEGYKELRADHPEIVVKDEEVEDALNNVREQHATFTSVEGRPLADGDFAQASMDGKPKVDRRRRPPARPHGRNPDRNRRQEHGAGVHREPARGQRRRRERVRGESIPTTRATSGSPARRSFTP